MKWCLLIIIVICCGCGVLSAQQYSSALLPVPSNVEWQKGKRFYVTPDVRIIVSSAILNEEVEELRRVLNHRAGISATVFENGKPGSKTISLLLDPTIKGNEAYCLDVSEKKICISASAPAGIFYGIMTLDQLLLADPAGIVPVRVEDAPRYGYRSLMLDPARNFLPLEDVRFYIDQMAKYKFNVLQLHLTDDQGWRVEIKKYPLLTEIGAFRNRKAGNNGPDNGFYTAQQLKDLVEYARKKHIEIVPELDIPGHTVAALAAYPQLGCTHTDTLPKVIGKTLDMMLCAGNDSVYQFYADVLAEVCAIFPSKRIHLGGDEAVIEKNWTCCERCQVLKKKLGYHKERELMNYFFGRINDIVVENNKQLLLWCELDRPWMPADEFLFHYPENCVLFTWRMGLTPKCIELTGKAGIPLIASPGEHCYFDYPQWKGDLPELNNWGMPLLSLKQAYDFDPGYGLPANEQAHIIGVAGLLWAEAIPDINRATYMTFPRALALAEAGWSRMENRSWESFKQRMYPNLTDLMQAGVFFRVPFEVAGRK